jgi:hypothetical protein
MWIDYPIFSLDAFNLIWGLIGILLDNFIHHVTPSAIGDCMKNYGIASSVLAKVFILMSLV